MTDRSSGKKKRVGYILVILVSLAMIGIVWVAVVLFLHVGVNSSLPDPVYSPDGSKVIVPTVSFEKDNPGTYLLVHLQVQETQSRAVLYEVQTRASHRMRWTVNWITDSMFKLDSSDIGSYCWAETNSGWSEEDCPD